ncbi:hypothetical protein QBC44DRAFT_354027 [Cladorrhinum sp. PSN332]|nr:hypothetical protein QBC44DRAFT_354027 [Cladorrhinum sp. PSN332]
MPKMPKIPKTQRHPPATRHPAVGTDSILGLERAHIPQHLRSFFLPNDIILFKYRRHSRIIAPPRPRDPSESNFPEPYKSISCIADLLFGLFGMSILCSSAIIFQILYDNEPLRIKVPIHLFHIFLTLGFMTWVGLPLLPHRRIRQSVKYRHRVRNMVGAHRFDSWLNHLFAKTQMGRMIIPYAPLGSFTEPTRSPSFYDLPESKNRDGSPRYGPIMRRIRRLEDGFLVARLERYPDLFTCPRLKRLNKAYLAYKNRQRFWAAGKAYVELERTGGLSAKLRERGSGRLAPVKFSIAKLEAEDRDVDRGDDVGFLYVEIKLVGVDK